MEKYIITGGEGFIGSKIATQTGGEAFDIKSGKDILDKIQLEAACMGAKGIFHCAAKISVPESVEHPEEYHHTNVDGTRSVVDTANTVGAKVVFSSSSAVYGDAGSAVSEEFVPSPLSPYAQNKLDGEELVMTSKMPGVVLRYFNVYGPGQSAAYAGVITIFIQQALRGEDLLIYGDGTQSRDFIFVDDVVRANIAAMAYQTNTCEIFNIATGQSVSIQKLAEKIIQIIGSSSKINYCPRREGDIVHSEANIAKVQSLLNWRPETELEDGLQKTIDYIRSLG